MRYLSGPDLAYFLQVSDQTLRSFRNNGMPYIKQNKGYTYDLEDVYEWLRVKSESEHKYIKYREKLRPVLTMNGLQYVRQNIVPFL